MRYYCTYFDRNYLTRGLALHESLSRHEKQPFHLFIVTMDELSRTVLRALNLRNVTLVPFHEIESNDPELLAVRATRPVREYLWTTTPTLILRLLEKVPAGEVLTYLDSDMYFFSDPSPILEELGPRDVLIHPHRFPARLKHLEAYGLFNVGLLCFRNSPHGRQVLADWRADCIDWCGSEVDNGRFGDQGYLTKWPGQYGHHLVISNNPGVGTAPWNNDTFTWGERDGVPTVDGSEVIFYHFHSCMLLGPTLIVPTSHAEYDIGNDVLRLCFAPYQVAMRTAFARVQEVFSGYDNGIFRGELNPIPNFRIVGEPGLVSEFSGLGIETVEQRLAEGVSAYALA